MPSGGHARSGPPPDPNALRRLRSGDSAGWTDILWKPRRGRAPKWPLADQLEREGELWREIWKDPRAVMWERHGLALKVALYVRKLARAEQPRSSVELLKGLNSDMDDLGLSEGGMARNRWRRVDVAAVSAQAPKASSAAPESAKARLKAIDGGKRDA